MNSMSPDDAREFLTRHSRSARNGVFPENSTHSARMVNPLCGDQVEIRIIVRNGKVSEAGFSAKACAICSASASILCGEIQDISRDSFHALKSDFEKTISDAFDPVWPESLRAFNSFSHLKVNPRRRGCAILPWAALMKALDN